MVQVVLELRHAYLCLYLIDGHALAYRTYFALTAGVDTLADLQRRTHRRHLWICP